MVKPFHVIKYVITFKTFQVIRVSMYTISSISVRVVRNLGVEKFYDYYGPNSS